MYEFKSNLLNRHILSPLLMLFMFVGMLFVIIRFLGLPFLFTQWYGYLLILLIFFTGYNILSTKQTLSFVGNKLVLKGVFHKSEINYSEIENIELVVNWRDEHLFLRINNTIDVKPIVLSKIIFSKNWEDIMRVTQERTNKTIKKTPYLHIRHSGKAV